MSDVSVITVFMALLRRDLLLAYRHSGDWLNAWVFFLMVCSLFALVMSPDPAQLAHVSANIVWVVALLVCLFSSDHLFRSDYADGSIEPMVLSPVPLYWQVMAKVCAHWLLTGLPLAVMAPLLGLLLYLPTHAILTLMISIGLGAVSLSAIAGIGAALTAGLRRTSGVLLSLIVLPLYVPVLIVGVGVVQAALNHEPSGNLLVLLGAFALLAVTLAPLAIAAGVRIGVAN